MAGDIFEALDCLLESGDRSGGLEYLIEHFRQGNDFQSFFEANLMKKRLELGLPLIQTGPTSEYPAGQREQYESGMVEAARQTGCLALAAGNIVRAWPYFRAIGHLEAMAQALERVQPEESSEQLINIAFREGVHPVKGLEWILHQHGMCQAITAFGMYQVDKHRSECIALLVRRLHAEVVERIARTIEANESVRPEGLIEELVEGREWLFGEYDTYIDTSHLLSVLSYTTEVKDTETLELLRDLCAYGRNLSAMFHSRGRPPFENPYVDYNEYILALLGNNIDNRIAHFRKKVADTDREEAGTIPAQLLIDLLARLGRHEEALQAALEHIGEEDAAELQCPSILQLCSLAKDNARLKQLARDRGDLLSYLAST